MNSDLSDAELDEASALIARRPEAERDRFNDRFLIMVSSLLAEVRRRRREDARAVYTTEAVARLLGYHADRIRDMCEMGRFPGAYRAGEGSHWRIPQEAVDAFREACRPKIRRRV